MQIGRMRERITLQTNAPTQDVYGGMVDNWSTDDEVWASVLPVRGFEKFAAGAVQEAAILTHRVSLRYRSSLTPRHRIVWETRVLDIERIENPDGKKHEHVLYCRERMEETVNLVTDPVQGNAYGLLLVWTYPATP